MRILFHSAHPEMPTGYGNQTALVVPRLAKLGHEVAISASAGQPSHPGIWGDIPVFPGTAYSDFGEDVVLGHYQGWQADLCITFLCVWPLNPMAWRDMRVMHLTPVDCSPMSARDYGVIERSGGYPAAISQHGEKMMRARGLDPLYLPHGVDTDVYRPPEDRAELRRKQGLEGKFAVGINAMNNDPFRKNLDDQMRAFAMFRKGHPDAVLVVHSIMMLPEGLNLPALAAHFGIPDDAVRWSDQYQIVTGMATPQALAAWYGGLDVVLNAGNEGFGLPAIEAQACGTPVILGNYSTGPELCGAGWKVGGQPKWNNTHQADWVVPNHTELVTALERAHASAHGPGAQKMRDKARTFAMRYDIGTVVDTYWKPVLDDLA